MSTSVQRLRKQIEEMEANPDPEWDLYGVLLEVTEEIARGLMARNMKRSELADRLGTSRAYVTKLLDGQENMTLKTLVRVANALEMKVDAKFIPRAPVRKALRKAQVKTAVGPRMRRGSPAKPPARKRVVVAARSKR